MCHAHARPAPRTPDSRPNAWPARTQVRCSSRSNFSLLAHPPLQLGRENRNRPPRRRAPVAVGSVSAVRRRGRPLMRAPAMCKAPAPVPHMPSNRSDSRRSGLTVGSTGQGRAGLERGPSDDHALDEQGQTDGFPRALQTPPQPALRCALSCLAASAYPPSAPSTKWTWLPR